MGRVDTEFGAVEVSHVCLNDNVVEGLRALDVPRSPCSTTRRRRPARTTRTTCSTGSANSSRELTSRRDASPCLSATDLQHVLVIGSGPIVIGQACEFDYSGTQACRVLRAEGLRVSLVNSNPATIMTDPEFADATYVEPITPEFVEQVIARERPDALLPTLGGQTALNTAVALHEAGVLDKYGVELIGANIDAIRRGEDRQLFKDIVAKARVRAGLADEASAAEMVPRSRVCHSMDEVRATVAELGLPVVIRPSFTMGGLGSGMAHTPEAPGAPRRRRARRLAGARGAHRGERARLEGVRARADARPARQRGGRLLDRERRPDGRAHRRLGDRRAGDDADRPGVPAPARPGHRRAARGRGGHRRLQHPVRGAPGRPAGWSSSR